MVEELTTGVFWLDLGGVNAYLVDDDGALTLVDAGMPWQTDGLVDGIIEAGYTLEDLDRVLITHYDLDHVGGLPRLDGLDVTVYTGVEAAPLVAGDRAPGWSSRKTIMQSVASFLYSEAKLPVASVADGESIGSFTVYRTPGHTAGHVAFVSEAHSVAFLGDLVRESAGELEHSPWFISEETSAVRESIRALAERAPEFDIGAMGHGVPFETRGSERLTALAATLPQATT